MKYIAIIGLLILTGCADETEQQYDKNKSPTYSETEKFEGTTHPQIKERRRKGDALMEDLGL